MNKEEKQLIKTMKSFEKSISLAVRRWRTYQFYKRNKWLNYVPFNQIKYMWIMALWKNQEAYIKQLMKIHQMIQKSLTKTRASASPQSPNCDYEVRLEASPKVLPSAKPIS